MENLNVPLPLDFFAKPVSMEGYLQEMSDTYIVGGKAAVDGWVGEWEGGLLRVDGRDDGDLRGDGVDVLCE